ncbi:hypothetical protein E2320_004602 [Naja naja]|nr:hypothetical protein E2320_004602 [Naja naja]
MTMTMFHYVSKLRTCAAVHGKGSTCAALFLYLCEQGAYVPAICTSRDACACMLACHSHETNPSLHPHQPPKLERLETTDLEGIFIHDVLNTTFSFL